MTQDQLLREINQLMQSWEQRIRFGNLRLAERFLNFELNILLHLRFNSGEEGILCFHQISPIEPIGSEEEVVSPREQGTVFIDVVKLTDSPERIVPTLVWFEQIDSLKRLKEDSLYFGSLCGFVFLGGCRDRKFDKPKLIFRERLYRRAFHPDQNKLACEVVKRSPQIMHHVSGDSHSIDRQGRNGLEAVGMEQLYGMGRDTRIWIGSENCRVIEGTSNGCEIVQVLFGPFDLNLHKNEAVLAKAEGAQ